jgi:hypothetical protein
LRDRHETALRKLGEEEEYFKALSDDLACLKKEDNPSAKQLAEMEKLESSIWAISKVPGSLAMARLEVEHVESMLKMICCCVRCV